MKKELINRLRSVTPDDFDAFFHDKNLLPLRCPVCNHSDMMFPLTGIETVISHDPNGFSHREFIIPNCISSESSPNSLTGYQYRIVCKNCTYELAFNALLLINWIEEKKKGIKNNEQ